MAVPESSAQIYFPESQKRFATTVSVIGLFQFVDEPSKYASKKLTKVVAFFRHVGHNVKELQAMHKSKCD